MIANVIDYARPPKPSRSATLLRVLGVGLLAIQLPWFYAGIGVIWLFITGDKSIDSLPWPYALAACIAMTWPSILAAVGIVSVQKARTTDTMGPIVVTFAVILIAVGIYLVFHYM